MGRPPKSLTRQAKPWSPSAGIFGPTTGLDVDLFDEHGRLRPGVAEEVMQRLDRCIRTDSGLAGSDWQGWTRVYLLGGSVSEWAGERPNGTARDLDVIVAVNLHEAERHNAFEGMDPGTAASALNAAFHRHFNDDHWRPSFGGVWSLTAFCNQRAWDVTAIRPYAAYDLTHGRWAVRPPHLPGHSLADFDPAVLAHARAVAAEARAILRMPEPLRTREATALWERIHAARSTAFGPEGTGWDDPGNVAEKWLAYAPRHVLDHIRELALAPRTAVRVYHGTSSPLTGVPRVPGTSNEDRETGRLAGFYTSTDPEDAHRFGRHVSEHQVSLVNPLHVNYSGAGDPGPETWERLTGQGFVPEDADVAGGVRAAGHDGVIVHHADGREWHVVLAPSALSPRTAAAEPEDKYYYHVSYERFPRGHMLRPEDAVGRNFDDSSGEHVYMTDDDDNAERYRYHLWEKGYPEQHKYEVRPTGPVEPDPNDDKAVRTRHPVEVVHASDIDQETGEEEAESDWFNHRTAAAQGYLRNPYHGTPEFSGNPAWSHTWFHGTRGEPDFGTRRKFSEEAQRAALPPEQRQMNSGWTQPNQHLGVHFSPLHEVGHKFAPSTWSGPTSIAHVRLRGSSPAHFETEEHLNIAMADWASQHYPHWHDDKLNGTMAWNYSDQEGTHRDFSRVPDDPGQRWRTSERAQSLLTWHPHMPEILAGFKAHLRGQGHHGITYGNGVEGPYDTDATRGGDASTKAIMKHENWPRGAPKSISAIADPEDIEITHVEHIAPWRKEPEGDQRAWEAVSDQDEPDEMRDRVLDYHRQQGGKLPVRLASAEHETWYHLTDNPHFTLDPQHEPADNAFALEDRSGQKGVYLGKSPEHWFSGAGEGYARPYLAEVHAHPSVKDAPGVHGRWGGEMFVPAQHFDRLHLHRVIPIDAYAREHYGTHGWIEQHHGTEFDTGKEIERPGFSAPLSAHYPFKEKVHEPVTYRYPGPDVRDMPPGEHARHRDRWLGYLKDDRGFSDEDVDYYRGQHDSHLPPRTATATSGDSQRPKRTPGNAMVYLDVPHGTVQPYAGQEGGHHVALAYLPRAIGDEDFAKVVDRAREAATRYPPLRGTLGGHLTFPPGAPSNKRRVAVVPATIPGVHRLQSEFGEFDRAHYAEYTPHVTRAQLTGNDPDPEPHPQVPVSFTHVHVRRGDEVHSFPLTGLSPAERATRDSERIRHPERYKRQQLQDADLRMERERQAVEDAYRAHEESTLKPWAREGVSGYDGLTKRSGMIYLDLPPGTVRPVPGGVDDHHITLVYLGSDVGDEAFAEACCRTGDAAAQCPPLEGVLRGIDIFPPSKSSDGKVPAFVPAYVGGIGRLRRLLEDLSASEHKDWRPHITLAYLMEGDSLPAPHPSVPLRFTHVHVKRGDDVVSFPLTGPLRRTDDAVG